MRPVVLLLCLLLSLPALASAQTEVVQRSVAELVEETEEQVEERRTRLAEIEERLADELLSTDELLALAELARELRQESLTAAQPLDQRIAVLDADLRRLGPAPEEGEPEEPQNIRTQRTGLEQRLAELQAYRAEVELNLAAAERIAIAVADRRREAFTGRLLAQGPTLLSPAEWTQAITTFLEGAGEARQAGQGWWQARTEAGTETRAILLLVGALVLALALMIPVRGFLQQRLFKRMEQLDAYPSRRILLAVLRTAARVLPGVVAGLFLYEAAKMTGLVTEEGRPLARSVWFGFLVLLLADGAVNSVFAPKLPRWRVARLATRSVTIIRGLVLLAAAVLVLDVVLRRGAEFFASSPSLTFVQDGVFAMGLAVLLFLLARDRLWTEHDDEGIDVADEGEGALLMKAEAPPGASEAPTVAVPTTSGDEKQPRPLWRRLRFLGRAAAVIALVAPLLGFVNLAHYVTTKAFALLALFGLVLAVRALMREGIRLLDKRFAASRAEHSEESSERLLYSWIGITIDIIAVALLIPPALLILGAEWSDVRGWIVDAFIGFQVGGVRVSFAKILTALGIFIVLMWVTRLVQKTADATVFPRSRIDPGVQNSLRTLMGYVGLILAVGAGIGALGFNLQNLAIIAGALSVGIGFGLQSIVNNFVSGLILLFERPIKVGDWIVTASGEGIVKRISVRSTEIETFDRSSIIVPNSELISSAVTNWTHKDKMGRLLIRIGVAYRSDAEKVIEVLEDVARKNDDVMNFPAPFVVFEDFGASSLDFSLRCYIRDIGQSLGVRTKLRVAIHKRFAEEGIEIPFPQRDLNLREVPSGFGGADEAAQS